MEQFLTSAVRTEDPSQANLFYIPAFQFTHSGGRWVAGRRGPAWLLRIPFCKCPALLRGCLLPWVATA